MNWRKKRGRLQHKKRMTMKRTAIHHWKKEKTCSKKKRKTQMNMMSSTRAETFMKRLKSKKLTFSQNWFKLKSQWSKKGSSKTNSIFKTGHHKRLQMRISPHKNARARTAT